jgi:hypothetical protein
MTDELLKRARQAGSDAEFREWIQLQPSCISGQFSEYLESSGEGRSIAAHYRTASNSGIATKPPYSSIPLTRAEHDEQHRVGQFNFMPRHWWEAQVKIYLGRWIVSRCTL